MQFTCKLVTRPACVIDWCCELHSSENVSTTAQPVSRCQRKQAY